MNVTDLEQERNYVEQGDLFDSQGKYPQAIAAYNNALAIAPDDADVLFDKGVTLARMGQPVEAQKFFDTAIALYVGAAS